MVSELNNELARPCCESHAREVAELRAELEQERTASAGLLADIRTMLAAERAAHAATKARLAEAEKMARTLIAHFDSCGECSECCWEGGQIDLKSDVVARLRDGGERISHTAECGMNDIPFGGGPDAGTCTCGAARLRDGGT